MTEKFFIKGGKKLEGEIEVNGSKNAAGALLAATLLTNEECILDNIPKISDILNLLDILKEMGKEVEWIGEKMVRVKGKDVELSKLNMEKICKSRVSVLLIGPLLVRFKEFKFSKPGGDRIGLRPITTHLEVLKELGVEIEEQGDFYYFKRKPSLPVGEKEIILSEFSVTATENLIMATVLADGRTTIKLAAQEPHAQDLISMLNKMGANIKKIWGNVLEIEGVKKLKAVEHKIIPDTNEAGTFLSIGAAIGKRILIKNLIPEHLDIFLKKLQEMGVSFKKNKDSIEISQPNNFKSVKTQALPYPGFPTDLLPLIVPLLTQAEGKSLIHDPLYENRLNYVHELRKMGADIEIVDPHRAFVFGKTALFGVKIESSDIRAGAALVLAGLMADGKTTIENIEQIDRGYEKIEDRLRGIGADIERVVE